jgi:hypothetical protein
VNKALNGARRSGLQKADGAGRCVFVGGTPEQFQTRSADRRKWDEVVRKRAHPRRLSDTLRSQEQTRRKVEKHETGDGVHSRRQRIARNARIRCDIG